MSNFSQSTSFSDLFKDKTRIGVIRGGETPEYELSLKTGGEILKRLRSTHSYDVHDVLIDKYGVWHIDGKIVNKSFLSDYIDLAWSALHGDDGEVYHHLETLGIPYLGPDPLSAELMFHRGKKKRRLRDLGLQTPEFFEMHNMYTGDMSEEDRDAFIRERAFDIFGKLPGPWVVKPLAFSARYHTYLAKTFPELITALRVTSMDVDDILIEEYVKGREFVSGIVPEFRNKEKYIIPAHEIKHEKEMFTHDVYRTGSFSMTPAYDVSPHVRQLMDELSEELHKEFNLSDTALIHFLLSSKGLYVMSVHHTPELHEHSPLWKGLEYLGAKPEDFIHSQIARLLRKKK